GCCLATSPPGCFNPSATQGQPGWVGNTQCGMNPGEACVIGTPAATPTDTAAPSPTPTSTQASGPTPTVTPTGVSGTQVSILNQSAATATAYISFSAGSAITQPAWQSFCSGSGNNCTFSLAGNGGTQALPNPSGLFLDFTVAFNSPVGCGATKAEVNV